MIAILSAVVAIYLGIAVYYAAFEALSSGETLLWSSAAAALAILGLASQINWRFGLILVLIVSFLAQLIWVSPIGLAMAGESAQFWQDAREFAGSLTDADLSAALDKLHASMYPAALAVYGLAQFLFDNVYFVQMLTAAVWTVQTWLVWKIACEVSETKSGAFACALIFGLSPTLIAFGGLPSVEAMFGLFVLSGLYVMLSHRKRGLAVSAAYSGALVALAFLTRPAGIGYLIGLIAVLAVGFAYAGNNVQRGRMAAALGAFLLGFGLGVSPQLALNYAMESRVGIATGGAIGEEILTGTDWGRSVDEQLAPHAARIDALAASLQAPEPAAALRRAEDLVSREIGMQRIAEDPLGFVGRALTEKMSLIWASEHQMLRMTLESPEAEGTIIAGPIGKAMPSVVGGWYLAMLVAAAAGALRLFLRGGAVRDPTRWVLVFIAFVSLAGATALGKPEQMRHLAFTPLLALLAPLPFARLPQVAGSSMRSRIRAAEQSAAPAEEVRGVAAPAPGAPAEAASSNGVSAPAPVAAATPKGPPETPVETWSAEQKLAHVLRSMSKPPRPPEEDENGDATAERA